MRTKAKASTWRKAIPCALTLLAGAAAAQTVVEQRSAADEMRYESPIRTYRPYSEEIVQPWQESNDQVGRIGGWRAYAKEIQNSEASRTSSANDIHKERHEGEGKKP